MEIDQVYVQSENGVPNDEAFFKAWEGFRKRRISCVLFEEQDLIDGTLELSRQTLVAGALRVVEQAMTMLGISVPEADNLPQCLAAYRGRNVWTSTWGELRRKYAEQNPSKPLFVKPLRQNKGFPAIALYDVDDIAAAADRTDEEAVLISEYVLFESEWRCFVLHGQVLNLCPYQGDPFRYPDSQVIKAALRDYAEQAPAGYGIDFGVLSDGRTVLVEANDGYSLGSYNLNSVEYSELLEARWLQLAS